MDFLCCYADYGGGDLSAQLHWLRYTGEEILSRVTKGGTESKILMMSLDGITILHVELRYNLTLQVLLLKMHDGVKCMLYTLQTFCDGMQCEGPDYQDCIPTLDFQNTVLHCYGS